jgi:protein-tyrosine phosphatase
MKKLGFVEVGLSHMTVWHKPGLKELKALKEELGITLILCLLYDKENPFPTLKEYED